MIGSVFSPYYVWAGRGDPENHNALNVGLYGPGVRRWTMTERGRSGLERDQMKLRIGPSQLDWKGNKLTLHINERSAPFSRAVRGIIEVEAPSITTRTVQLDNKGRHFWRPVTPRCRVLVDLDAPDLQWSGDAYLDSNWGSEPLEAGFQSWDWCRAPLGDTSVIFYDAILKDGGRRRIALKYDANAQAQESPCPAPIALTPGPIWRVKRSVPADTHVQAQTIQMLEDTPFYTRSRLAFGFDGAAVTGVHESLDLKRFMKPWVLSLLPFRMPRRPR